MLELDCLPEFPFSCPPLSSWMWELPLLPLLPSSPLQSVPHLSTSVRLGSSHKHCQPVWRQLVSNQCLSQSPPHTPESRGWSLAKQAALLRFLELCSLPCPVPATCYGDPTPGGTNVWKHFPGTASHWSPEPAEPWPWHYILFQNDQGEVEGKAMWGWLEGLLFPG